MKHSTCPTCNTRGTYSDRFDAFVCGVCDTWLESKCSGPCNFCDDRPVKPSDFYLRKPETFETMTGDAIELEHFRSLVVSGAIMYSDEDISVGSIFVDGVAQVQIALDGWGSNYYEPVSKALTKIVKLDDLDKLFPGKPIHIEVLHKSTTPTLKGSVLERPRGAGTYIHLAY